MRYGVGVGVDVDGNLALGTWQRLGLPGSLEETRATWQRLGLGNRCQGAVGSLVE